MTYNNSNSFVYDGLYLKQMKNYMGQVIKEFNYRGTKISSIQEPLQNKTIIFDYDYRGRRTKKLNQTANDLVEYYYDENLLIKEKHSNYSLNFLYNENNELIGFERVSSNNSAKTKYFYLRNAFNDIVEILDVNGNSLVHYLYDAYGNTIEIIDNSSNSLATINPFRYRGYYYDGETQLYWVSSRYYSPELCRWISPDSIEYLDSQSINGLNLYAYCNNNPIMYVDPTGHFIISSIIIGVIIGFVTTGIKDYVNDGKLFNGDISGWEYFGSILGGAIGGLGAGLGTTILSSGLGNVIEAAFAGDISSFEDVMFQFALGGLLGVVGYGISKGITSIFADKKIFGILGNLADNAKVNKRLAKAGFGYLKIGKHGFNAVYDELYKKLGYGIIEKTINSSYDFAVELVF